MKYLNKAVLMEMLLAIALYVIMYAMHVRCAFLSIRSVYYMEVCYMHAYTYNGK